MNTVWPLSTVYLLILHLTGVLCSEAGYFTPCNGKSELGGVCDTNVDCELKGSICLRGKCRCHPHYAEAYDEKGRSPRCKPLPSKIGAACSSKCREPLFCRNGECQCVQRGTTRVQSGECITTSRVGDRCSRHYDCTAPFSACLNSTCVCITGTIQQGSRCVAAANCPLGGLPGQTCVRRISTAMVHNLPPDQDDCPPGQACVTAGDTPIGHCCPVVCPLASHVDRQYSCDPTATQAERCPSDTHFCHLLSDGGFSQSVCCRRPCNAMAPNALYANNQCIPRGQLNSACYTEAQCGGGEGMQCIKTVLEPVMRRVRRRVLRRAQGRSLGARAQAAQTLHQATHRQHSGLVRQGSTRVVRRQENPMGQCQCLEGFHPTVDALTHPMKNPSQTCSRDCASESMSRDTSCMKPVELAAQCFIQQQCPKNSGCYRGRCLCRCGFELKNARCEPLPPPPTTTAQPSINLVPGLSVPKGNDILKIFGQLFGGGGSPNGGIQSFLQG